MSDYVRLANADDANAGNGKAVVTYADPAEVTTTTTSTTTTTTTTVPPVTTTTTTVPPNTTTTTTPPVVTRRPVVPRPTPGRGARRAPVAPAAAPVAADPSALAFTGLNVLPLLVSGLSLIFLGAASPGRVPPRAGARAQPGLRKRHRNRHPWHLSDLQYRVQQEISNYYSGERRPMSTQWHYRVGEGPGILAEVTEQRGNPVQAQGTLTADFKATSTSTARRGRTDAGGRP